MTNSEEAIHIATELLHSKLIFPTAKTDDTRGVSEFSKKQYYSISEDIAITATKNQRAMIKIRSQLRNLEEMLMEMKEGFSEVDTTRAADMVAINNYVKAQSKYNRALLWVIGVGIVGLSSPLAKIVNLDVVGFGHYTKEFLSSSEWLGQWIGWSLVVFLVFMFVRWMTKSHAKQLSSLSRALGVGAAPKMSIRSSMDQQSGSSALTRDSDEAQGSMKLAMDLHKKLAKAKGSDQIVDGAPMYTEFPGALTDEADCWSESPGDVFKVRGPNYIKDGIKIQSRLCAFKLLHVEFFAVDEGVKVENIAGRSDSFGGKLRKEATDQGKEPPFLFVVCFNFPGYAFACYFQRRVNEKNKDPAFDGLFKKFVENGDDFRDERFKILPGIPPGGANFLVRKTVGNKVCCYFFFLSINSLGSRHILSIKKKLTLLFSYCISSSFFSFPVFLLTLALACITLNFALTNIRT